MSKCNDISLFITGADGYLSFLYFLYILYFNVLIRLMMLQPPNPNSSFFLEKP